MSNDVSTANEVESVSEINTNEDLFDDDGAIAAGDDDHRQGDPILDVTELEKHYIDKQGLLERVFARDSEPTRVRAVDGVSFTVNRGETLGIVGESGCGKSTLAETLLGLKQPTGGSASLFGKDIHEWVDVDRKRFAKQIQFVFQDPSSCLDPKLTVRELIREPLEIHSIGDNAHKNQLVQEVIEQVGLSADQLDRYPSEMSGGQRQRVGIARAIILKPQLLVLDEPTSALDVSVQAQILNLLKEIQESFNLTTVIISHDISVIQYLCDTVLVMYLGQIAEIGPTDRVFSEPAHPYTQTLFDSVPKVGVTDAEHTDIDPDIPSPRDPPDGCRFHTRCPDVIPPAEYDLEQEEWLAVFKYKLDINSGKLTSEKLRELRDDLDVDHEAPMEELVRERYDIPSPLSDSAAETALDETLDYLLDDDIEALSSLLARAFRSPCEATTPDSISVSEDHMANCHLVLEDEV
ncbi:ABC transporter ATP-binding protein [Haloarcula marina]|uniref:ABC transporter ATP-binding protein n=1 Tax=Haloarcula marina TaxID=2961574 RepID=UPI0020B88B71|nr:oligopeptide/dipeptide ABC transporter ATP-binding protein [Halomicroarcula marina]